MYTSVQCGGDGSGRGLQHRRESVFRDRLVVPREGIRLRNAGAGQVVVKLVPEEAGPGRPKGVAGILAAREPVGGDRQPLGGVGERLVAPVPPLHLRLGGVAAGPVVGHEQLPPEAGKPVEGGRFPQEFRGEPIGGRAQDPHRPVSAQAPRSATPPTPRWDRRPGPRCRSNGRRAAARRRSAGFPRSRGWRGPGSGRRRTATT